MNAQQRRQAGRANASQPGRVRADAPSEATQVHLQMRRIDASQLAANDVAFEPPEFKSTPDSRAERARTWRSIFVFYAVVLAALACVIVIATR